MVFLLNFSPPLSLKMGGQAVFLQPHNANEINLLTIKSRNLCTMNSEFHNLRTGHYRGLANQQILHMFIKTMPLHALSVKVQKKI